MIALLACCFSNPQAVGLPFPAALSVSHRSPLALRSQGFVSDSPRLLCQFIGQEEAGVVERVSEPFNLGDACGEPVNAAAIRIGDNAGRSVNYELHGSQRRASSCPVSPCERQGV